MLLMIFLISYFCVGIVGYGDLADFRVDGLLLKLSLEISAGVRQIFTEARVFKFNS